MGKHTAFQKAARQLQAELEDVNEPAYSTCLRVVHEHLPEAQLAHDRSSSRDSFVNRLVQAARPYLVPEGHPAYKPKETKR